MTQVILTHIPSKLIRLALNDLRICESQPEKYKINMDTWYNFNDGICSVCLAGAVMANTTNENFYNTRIPYGDNTRIPYRDKDNRYCYMFLNRMRYADCRKYMFQGCDHIDATPIPWDKEIPYYEKDLEGFHKAMNDLADAFEASGQ